MSISNLVYATSCGRIYAHAERHYDRPAASAASCLLQIRYSGRREFHGIRRKGNCYRPRLGTTQLFLEENNVAAPPFSADALQLTPLIQAQHLSQIEIHECVFTFQLAARCQQEVDLRTDLA